MDDSALPPSAASAGPADPPARAAMRLHPALRPARHVDAAGLRQLAQDWCLLGWLPERERLLGWRIDATMPIRADTALPPALRIPGLRHVFWDEPASGSAPDPLPAGLPGQLHAGPWPGNLGESDPAGADALAAQQLALLDRLVTDDPVAARLAGELGIPLWWVGSTPPPAHVVPERQVAPETPQPLQAPDSPSPTPAPETLAGWAALIGPVAAMYAAAHPAGDSLGLLGDEQAAVQQCFEAFQQGDHRQAQSMARRLLVPHPHRSDLWHLLGVLAQQSGDLALAAAHFEHVTHRTPGFAQGWQSLALAESARGRLAEALLAVQHAVAASPGHAGLRTLHARLLQQTGHTELAATEAANALLLAPDNPGALKEQADALARLGRMDEAAALYRRALQQHPGALDLHFNLGILLSRSGHADEALPHFDQVLASTGPDHPLHLRSTAERARAHAACGAWTPAVSDARRAHALAPSDVNHLRRLVRLERQVRHPERALAALEAFAATSTMPADLQIDHHLLRRELADWTGLDALAALAAALHSLLATPTAALPTPADLRWLSLQDDTRPAATLLLQRAWQRTAADATTPPDASSTTDEPQPRTRPRGTSAPNRRLRIAYAYAERPDRRDADWVQAVLAEHDAARFDAWACSWGRTDGLALRTHEQADEASLRLIDLTGHTDLAAQRHLSDLGIDVLLDLEGSGLLNRAGILARRVATLQLTWLERHGQPLPAWIDAALAQREPLDDGDRNPRRVDLPHAHLVLHRQARARLVAPAQSVTSPPSRALAGLPERAPVLACWAPCSWIQPDIFQLWMRLLHACPPAVLWLRDHPTPARQHLLAAAQEAGIAPGRLVFAETNASSPAQGWLGLADLHLAPGPQSDPHSLGEALAAGLPTLAFDTQEACASATPWLEAAGLDATTLVCHDLASYEARARHHLRHPRELMALRRRLGEAAGHAPLFDVRRHVRQLEAVMEELHERLRIARK